MKYLFSNNFFLIAIGAVPAAIFRWQIDQIWIVNIIGCFLLGFVNAMPISRRYKLIFGFGFCGSLTTFSGWSFQLFKLISHGFYKLFFLNSILTVIIGLLAVCLGHFFAKKIKA
ncbi:fluoride efflux transporter FluC [Prochlorococcus marinus]|uniref:fluoride efflux transporter FluC n=1 Tax=Prochlorococcus marinus TaxID=1219 RepID=UPI0022B34865|nr:CrcB family protein [Prochlorococcus marinus]